MDNRIIVPLSKRRILLLLIGALAFVVIGLFGAIRPDDLNSPIMRSTGLIRIFSIASVVFFGLGSVFVVRKVFDKRPGLIIDQYGITDNTNAASIGLIEWDDITGVETRQVVSTKLLILYTKDPDKYIERVRNIILKRAAELNFKTYGSPITIISNSLQISFNDLEKLVKAEIEKRK